MLPQSHEFSHAPCLNNFFQVWFIYNQRYQVPLFIYINLDYGVYHLVIGRKVLGGIKYLMRSVKKEAEAIGIWTEDNWDMKIMN